MNTKTNSRKWSWLEVNERWAAVVGMLLLLMLPVWGVQGAVIFTTLHSFQACPKGEYPQAALIQGNDGNFYGTTQGGGTNGGNGTVFKINTNGALTSLYSFTGGKDGAGPNGLVQGSDGNLYGTTGDGGAYTNQYGEGNGTVFKISANGAFTTLHSFTGTNDGANPQAALVQGSDGYLYGTTYGGGTNFDGTVFRISTNGALTTLYSFTGGNDGASPAAGLVQGSDGYFYGTSNGGTHGAGTVFKISTNGALTTLYAFGSITDANGDLLDGACPYAALVQASDGDFYGTTEYGGRFGHYFDGYGTVFKISTNGALTSLHAFGSITNESGEPLDGTNPRAALVQGSDGYLYGTTQRGGATNYIDDVGTSGYGTVFRISTNGVLSSLYSFTGGNDGANPQAGLVQGSDGSLYGTTEYGGTTNYNPMLGTYGTVFKISTNGALTSLYSFTGGKDGGAPNGLVQGSDGAFYGTTGYSPALNWGAYGTVFKISTNGTLSSLYSFSFMDPGLSPEAGLVQGSDGYLYGTTEYGGTNNSNGTVFRISVDGALTSLYSFTGANDGAWPRAALVQGSDACFYGTTPWGANGIGTVFKISTNGALTTLYSFTGSNDGGAPQAALVQGSDGNFYGTTYGGGAYTDQYGQGFGTVFKISTNGALTSLYSFTGTNDGAGPNGLVQGSDGNFYGTTGGNGWRFVGFRAPALVGCGTVFKTSTDGLLTTLHAFGSITNESGEPLDGANPRAALVQGNDGYLYGTTGSGGAGGNGTVFKISTNGVLTTLYSFAGGNDGVSPNGLVQGSDGSFYGTTLYGGAGGAGTVFRLTIVPEPQLTIIPSGPYVILAWPTNYAGFTLQSTTNLGSSAVWSTNFSPPVIIGGENVVINAISGRQQFYRLSQ